MIKYIRKHQKDKDTEASTAFDYVYRIYKPAIQKAVFNMYEGNMKLTKSKKNGDVSWYYI